MQMTIIERCSFLFADCNFYSHEGKSACQPRKAGARSLEDLPSANFCSHEGKSASQPKRLAHGLWKICRVQRYTIYLTSPNKSRRNIYKKNFKSPKTQDT